MRVRSRSLAASLAAVADIESRVIVLVFLVNPAGAESKLPTLLDVGVSHCNNQALSVGLTYGIHAFLWV